MSPKIIHKDEDMVIVSKPSGWITNEASTTGKTPVLQSWIRENFKFSIFSFPECRDGIVHRLDKETSGILLIAKTKDAFENLQGQFKERKVKKTYTALVHGKVEPEEGVINAPVGRLPWNRERFGVLPGGRSAKTKYKVKRYYGKNGQEYSLVKLHPETGRTHQIRIHLKHIGHPIVSDEFYAGRKTARADRKWCPRLFLHASEISFTHPTVGETQKVKSEVPDDLKKALKALRRI